ncbi:hypothetical protein ACRRTK_010331 [Alexandromys fortis]
MHCVRMLAKSSPPLVRNLEEKDIHLLLGRRVLGTDFRRSPPHRHHLLLSLRLRRRKALAPRDNSPRQHDLGLRGGRRWLSSECPSRVLSAVVSFRTPRSLPDCAVSAVLVRQAFGILPETADCYENLCHINRNKARTLAEKSASKCQQLFSSNLWNTIASAQPCDWEEIPA